TTGMVVTTTHRVIHRVLRVAGHLRALALPAHATRLAHALVHLVDVRKLANGGAAAEVHLAAFTGRQRDDHVVTVTPLDGGEGAGGADKLAALAGVHLDVVNLQALGDGAKLHAVSKVGFDADAGFDVAADLDAMRAENVGLGAV